LAGCLFCFNQTSTIPKTKHKHQTPQGRGPGGLLRTSSMNIELGAAKIKILVFGAFCPPTSFKTNHREIQSTKKHRHISIQTTLLAARCILHRHRNTSNVKLLSSAMLRSRKKTQHVGFLQCTCACYTIACSSLSLAMCVCLHLNKNQVDNQTNMKFAKTFAGCDDTLHTTKKPQPLTIKLKSSPYCPIKGSSSNLLNTLLGVQFIMAISTRNRVFTLTAFTQQLNKHT
jgi:hypothetical protein